MLRVVINYYYIMLGLAVISVISMRDQHIMFGRGSR